MILLDYLMKDTDLSATTGYEFNELISLIEILSLYIELS
jgi:hypothetical protein